MEEKDILLKEFQAKYPEDLNRDYNCYIWYTQRLDENHNSVGNVTYYVCLKDKWSIDDKNPNGETVFLKGSENIQRLQQLLNLYLTL